jgi:hypothetical protein
MHTDLGPGSFMKLLTALTTLVCSTALAVAEPAKESDYYRITTFPIPADAAIEVGSMELLPDGKVALGTRRGDIFLASDVKGEASAVRFKLFATGQREVLGLGYKDGALYATDRAEVVSVRDKNGDGLGDTYEILSDAWGVTGDGHEYAFGSRFDKNGDLWVALCLTGSFTSEALFRGWALRIKPDGTMVPTASGIRHPAESGLMRKATLTIRTTKGRGTAPPHCSTSCRVPSKVTLRATPGIHRRPTWARVRWNQTITAAWLPSGHASRNFCLPPCISCTGRSATPPASSPPI